jgi:alpha-tubulin suppressor-like RCC1 family protein
VPFLTTVQFPVGEMEEALGNGGTSNKYTPTITSNLGANRTAVAISSGGYHTCAILDNGLVSCWGWNGHGALGNGGTSSQAISSPALTNSLGTGRTAVAISSGNQHTCAILDNGSVSCWGINSNGQLVIEAYRLKHLVLELEELQSQSLPEKSTHAPFLMMEL